MFVFDAPETNWPVELILHPCLCCWVLLGEYEDIFLIWIRVHLLHQPSESPLCFPFNSALISSIMFPRHTQLYLPFSVVVVAGISPPDIILHFVLLHQTSMKNPHALIHMHIQTKRHKVITHVFLFLFFGIVFIWVCISLFYVLLTAEWHQQVSWLGQFGWYICYYQHPTFRRIPGSLTDLSNLMLKWKQTLLITQAYSLAVHSTAQICRLCSTVCLMCSCYCPACLQYQIRLRLFHIKA